jgi:large conductance mechanosensitive channel
MKKTLEEFRNFAMRGSVIDLAIGLVIGNAFHKILSELVENVIMPLLGIITGGNNLSTLSYSFKSATINYGMFMQSVVDFIIIAFALFLTVKMINRFNKKKEAEAKPAPTPNQEVLLTEIRDILKNNNR